MCVFSVTSRNDDLCLLLIFFSVKAIGLRMTCENEADQRSRQKRAIQAQINEKRAELDRYYTTPHHTTPRFALCASIHLSSFLFIGDAMTCHFQFFLSLQYYTTMCMFDVSCGGRQLNNSFCVCRYTTQCQSLERIEAEQNIQLERLNVSQNN